MQETLLDWPRSVNPTLIEHLHRLLFGETERPCAVEVAEITDSARLQLVVEGRGVAMVLASTMPEHVPGIAFRRFEDPVPMIEVGLVWFDVHVSPFVPAFIDLARDLSDSVSRNGGKASYSAA